VDLDGSTGGKRQYDAALFRSAQLDPINRQRGGVHLPHADFQRSRRRKLHRDRRLLGEAWYPIITGCIKIDAQSKTSPGTWTDVTAEILKLGWTGRNINPQVGYYGVSSRQRVLARAQSLCGGCRGKSLELHKDK
jgi:hypothetical protein